MLEIVQIQQAALWYRRVVLFHLIHRLENVGDHLFVAVDRNDELFCHECYRYVLIFIEKAADEPVFFSTKFHVDRGRKSSTSSPLGIIHLVNDEIVTAEIMPDIHSQDFLIDLRNAEYDSDIYIGFQKKNEPMIDLQVDVSHTVFITLFLFLVF